jgi:hypothetical protein
MAASTYTVVCPLFFVTGDKDLLVLSALYPSVTPADFWHKHGE